METTQIPHRNASKRFLLVGLMFICSMFLISFASAFLPTNYTITNISGTGANLTAANNILVNEPYFYITASNMLYEFSTSNPQVILRSYNNTNPITDIAIGGGYIYLSGTKTTQLNATSFTEITSRTTTSTTRNMDILYNGTYVYLGARNGTIYQVNSTNISQTIATYYTGSTTNVIEYLKSKGTKLYAGNDFYIWNFNLSNISTLISSVYAFNFGTPVVIDDNYVYSTDTHAIRKYDRNNLSILINSTSTTTVAQDMTISGNYLYAVGAYYSYPPGSWESISQIDLTTFQEVATYNFPNPLSNGGSNGVIVYDDYVFAGSYGETMYVLSKSNVSVLIDNYTRPDTVGDQFDLYMRDPTIINSNLLFTANPYSTGLPLIFYFYDGTFGASSLSTNGTTQPLLNGATYNVAEKANVTFVSTQPTSNWFDWLVDGVSKLAGFGQNVFNWVFNNKASSPNSVVTLLINQSRQENADEVSSSGTWVAVANLTDGDWNSYSEGGNPPGNLYLNYTIKSGYLPTSTWQVKYDNYSAVTTNFSIPSECWNDQKLQFMIQSLKISNSYGSFYCRNSSGEWTIIFDGSGDTYSGVIWEEAMLWNISETYNINTSSANPNLQIIYPANGSIITQETMPTGDLNYTFSDETASTCGYSLNGGANQTITCGTNVTGITYLAGANTITLYANDSVGNINMTTSAFTWVKIAYNSSNVIYQCGTIPTAGTYTLNQSITGTATCLNVTSTNVSLLFNNSYGNINFPLTNATNYGNISLVSGLATGNIIIGNNTAYVNSTANPSLNIPANITLNKPTTTYVFPTIMKDGLKCTTCTSYTSNLNLPTVQFGVTGFSNYTIGDVPSVVLNYPTAIIPYGRSNGTLQLNITVNDSNLGNVSYNYETTNQTNVTLANLFDKDYSTQFSNGINYSFNLISPPTSNSWLNITKAGYGGYCPGSPAISNAKYSLSNCSVGNSTITYSSTFNGTHYFQTFFCGSNIFYQTFHGALFGCVYVYSEIEYFRGMQNYNSGDTNYTGYNTSRNNTAELTNATTTSYTLVDSYTVGGFYIYNMSSELKSSSGSYTQGLNQTIYYTDGTTASQENTTVSTSYVQMNFINPNPTKRVSKVEWWGKEVSVTTGTWYSKNRYVGWFQDDVMNVTLTNKKSVTIYANDNDTNINTSTFNWDYKVFENSRTYTNSIFETATASYGINVTANSSLTAVSLNRNGTLYPLTNYGSGIWNTSFALPAGSAGNNSISFQFTYDGTTINSDTTYQTISTFDFGICNASRTYPVLNITFKDEVTLAAINATMDSSEWQYSLTPLTTSGAPTKEYNFQNATHNLKYQFCANSNSTFYSTETVRYSEAIDGTYPQRSITYINEALSSLTQVSKELYLLSYPPGRTSNYQVITVGNQVVAGAHIRVEREIGGVVYQISDGYTDASGQIEFFLNPNYEHTFTITATGFATQSQTIRPSQAQYTITLGTQTLPFSYTNPIEGVTYVKWPNSGQIENAGVYNFTFDVYSSLGNKIYNCSMNIRHSNGTILGSATGCITYPTPGTGGKIGVPINVTGLNTNQLFGEYMIGLANGTYYVERDAQWRLVPKPASRNYWSTLKGFVNDSINLPEWGGGCGEGYHLATPNGKWYNLSNGGALVSEEALWCYNDSMQGYGEGDRYWGQTTDFSRIVFFFLIFAIIMAMLNFYTGYDTAYPGAFIYIMTGVVVLGSMINGAVGPGYFYMPGAISGTHGTWNGYSVFFDNWILAINFVLLSFIYFFTTNKRYQAG